MHVGRLSPSGLSALTGIVKQFWLKTATLSGRALSIVRLSPPTRHGGSTVPVGWLTFIRRPMSARNPVIFMPFSRVCAGRHYHIFHVAAQNQFSDQHVGITLGQRQRRWPNVMPPCCVRGLVVWSTGHTQEITFVPCECQLCLKAIRETQSFHCWFIEHLCCDSRNIIKDQWKIRV